MQAHTTARPGSALPDLLLGLVVAGVVAILIVPLAPGQLDALVSTNIGLGLLVLLAALFTRDATHFTAFPRLLLLLTLFRLSLNVASTRLILLEADAGQVIDAFGNFVVGGEPLVGIVVFLVLVLIQFVVIAKGSGRAAEVAARFRLDGLAGRQMSIDADLNRGLIGPAEARAQRSALQREVDVAGAMEGGMKFVKGDAIAGLVISLINIAGGLLLGVTQRGMSAAEALDTYTILTIGDGLVSQIPALLISVAAGLVVTRVDDSTDSSAPRGVASELVGQLAHARALVVASVLMFTIAASHGMTGLPPAPFLVLGAVCGVGALVRGSAQHVAMTQARSDDGGGVRIGDYELCVQVHKSLAERCVPESDERGPTAVLEERLEGVRATVARKLGLPLPNLRVVVPADGAGDCQLDGYLIGLGRGVLAVGSLPRAWTFATGTAEGARDSGVDGEWTRLPATHARAFRASVDDVDALMGAGLEPIRELDWIGKHFERVLLQSAQRFCGVQETRHLLDLLRSSHPELVEQALDGRTSICGLASLFSYLVDARAPLTDLRSILEVCASPGRPDPEQHELIEQVTRVRGSLRSTLCLPNTGPGMTLAVHRLSPDFEQLASAALRDVLADRMTGAVQRLQESLPGALDGSVFALEEPNRERLNDMPAELVGPHEAEDFARAQLDLVERDPVLLVSDARLVFLLRELLRDAYPEVTAIAMSELPEGIALVERPWVDLPEGSAAVDLVSASSPSEPAIDFQALLQSLPNQLSGGDGAEGIPSPA